MISLGLSAEELDAFEASLTEDHEIRITARILTLEHKVVGELTGSVLSGQVDVDATQDVRRSAQITILDPGNELGIDTDSPSSAGAMANRMLQIFYGVWSQRLPRWVDVPVFAGPITKTDRDSEVVTMAAHSKEALALDPCCRNLTVRKGAQKTSAVVTLLREAGETRFSVPSRPDRLTANVAVAGTESLWARAKSIAQGIAGGYTLDYDGRGTAILKDTTGPVVWTFRRGSGESLLSEPVFTVDTTAIKNVTYVHGGVPKGAKGAVWAIAHAQANHPFSAKNLGRNGKPRYLREDITNEQVTVKEAAQGIANDKLWELLNVGIDAAWDSAVIPHLEPYDMVRVVGEHATFTTAAIKYSIPLTSDGRMTHGRHWNRRTVNGVAPRRRKNPRIPRPKPAAKPKAKTKAKTKKR